MRKVSTNVTHSATHEGDIRVRVLIFVVVFFALVIGARLWVLQVERHESYAQRAEEQHTVSQFLEARRGEIYLRDKDAEGGVYPVAVNREYPMVYVAPNRVRDTEAVVKLLESVLGKSRAEVEAKLVNRNDPFEIIERRVSPEQKQAIESSGVEGVFVYPEEFRYYPGGSLASHVLGFVGSDGQRYVGRYGIEASFENILGGVSGRVTGKRDAGGRPMRHEGGEYERPVDGSDIMLSIDHAVQYEAERILREAIEENDADGGSLVVMEADTGKVLAIAGFPHYNPNEYSQVEDLSLFLNHGVQSSYECGSVFKPLTLAMGLDQGKITPESTYTDTGIISSGGYEIQNSDLKSYGLQTMTQVLEKSLNTGTVHVEKLIGNKTFAQYVERFGFGELTGSGFIGESPGNIRNIEGRRPEVNFFTASFGQGIAVTPLQLARAYGALANGGRLMEAQFLDRVVHADGTVEEILPVETRRVIQESTARDIGIMLENVVVNGHGKKAQVPGYRVAGKTGTAQVAKKGERGYDEGVTIGSFAGFAPVENPRFVVVVKVDHPKKVIWAESVAAPAFGKMMDFLLRHAKVPPTENVSES